MYPNMGHLHQKTKYRRRQ